MNLNFSGQDMAFRKEVSDFLEREFTPAYRQQIADRGSLSKENQISWQKKLHEKGWMAPNWPKQYGGTGWGPTQKYLFQQEMGKVGAPGAIPFGVSMVGPVIYTFGSEAQKERFLPAILDSSTWWCQGYSEPNSGSDLASLSTSAVRDGGYYIVNGTKTWTTLAQYADWIFCLVRTDPKAAKKQQGISFLLIDMKSPGVEVQPIITIDESHEVNSVFFTNVKVPAENLVGEENQGWTYAKFLLAHERTGIAGTAQSRRELNKIGQLAKDLGKDSDPDFSRSMAEVNSELTALEMTELRGLERMAAGQSPGPESSILKIVGTKIQQALTEMSVRLASWYAIQAPLAEGDNRGGVGPEFSAKSAARYFNYRKVTIYGGTNEIQKNIIAKAILGI